MKRIPHLHLPGFPDRGTELRLDNSQSHHLQKVLRLKKGQELCLLDGLGHSARAWLIEDGRSSLLNVESPILHPRQRPELELWLPLIRTSRLEMAIEKAVELGASRIRLYLSDYTGNQDRKPDLARLGRVMSSALEQSFNPWLPLLEMPQPLDVLLEDQTLLLTAHPGGSSEGLNQVLDQASSPLALLCGPEGGFSPEEEARLLKRSDALVSLGHHVLRAETAMICMMGSVRALAHTNHSQFNEPSEEG